MITRSTSLLLKGVTIAVGVLALTGAMLPRLEAATPPSRLPGIHMWDVNFTLEDVAEQKKDNELLRRDLHLTDIYYAVLVEKDTEDKIVMNVHPGTITGTFFEKSEGWAKGGHTQTVWQSTGKLRPLEELKPGRRVVTCDSRLSVETEGSREAPDYLRSPNTFLISGQFKADAKWTLSVFSAKPFNASRTIPGASPLTAPAVDSAVPYDFQLELNSARDMSLPEDERHTGAGFRMIKRTISYSIKRKPLAFQYVPSRNEDNLIPPRPAGVEKCGGCKPISTFYAEDDSVTTVGGQQVRVQRAFVHGNSRIHLLVDGKAFTDRFSTIRLWRNWDAPLVDDYSAGLYRTRYPFDDDNLNAGPKWSDAPGQFFPGRSSQWPRQSVLQEYLVAVKDIPEFGFLYYTVVVDTKPGAYRVRMSPGRKITAAEWCDITRSSEPQKDYRARPAVDSDWRRAP